MECLPEQIERIILSKLHPNDREALIQSMDGWNDRYGMFLVNWPQYIPLDLGCMDVFLCEYRILVKQILDGNRKCIEHVGMRSSSQHATFLYDHEDEWIPFFRYCHPSMDHSPLWCVGDKRFHVLQSYFDGTMTEDDRTIAVNISHLKRPILRMYKQYTFIMQHYLQYFEGICDLLREAFLPCIPSALSKLLRVLILHKRFACTGILFRDPQQNANTFTMDYDPSEFMHERIFIRCKHPSIYDQVLFECNEVTHTLSLQSDISQTSLDILLELLAKYSHRGIRWKVHWMGEMGEDPLVHAFPEIPCKPRWKVYKKDMQTYLQLF